MADIEKPPVDVIDLDGNATTPLHPQVCEAMCRSLKASYGNSSSDNVLGRQARALVEQGRARVADLIESTPERVVFTPGATEAINLAVLGVARSRIRLGRRHGTILTSRLEHNALLETIRFVQEEYGFDVTLADFDGHGRVTAETVRAAMDQDVFLVCLSHGNNEIGSINPVGEIGEVVAGFPGALLLVDAVQTLAYDPPSVRRNHIDLMVLSAHKMYGPKGIGGLYVGPSVELEPILRGGGQESGLWPGTINQVLVDGFGVAARLACEEAAGRAERVTSMRELLLGRLRLVLPDLRLNGHPTERLPGNLNLTIPWVPSIKVRKRLPRLALAEGSACTSRNTGPSHVLEALGLDSRELSWTVRIGITAFLEEDDIERAAEEMIGTIQRLRGVAGETEPA